LRKRYDYRLNVLATIARSPSVQAPVTKTGAKQLSLAALFEKHGAQVKAKRKPVTVPEQQLSLFGA